MDGTYQRRHDVQFCVVGGGMAGVCAAIAAARHGVKTVLMQDRPMLGGNASSEIRMWICGAHGENNRETGIVEEIMLENYYRNTGLKYTVWDSVVYEKVKAEPNITLLLNCSCLDARTENGRIVSVTGWQTTTQTYHTVYAQLFADCSGDSILAPLTGAAFTYGREPRALYHESIAPVEADRKTMGMSCLFQIRETDSPKPFIKPEWAYTYPTDADIPHRPQNTQTNYWYIEVGGEQDCIRDTEELRDELLKIAFGVWDHLKNQGDHGMENWELDWIGFLPGKRESRRYIGAYVVNQNDVEAGGRFEDIVGYGGWSMDDHFPAGFYHKESHPTIYHPAPSPWGIPYRALYSTTVENLLFAGRNISVTHTAMSSSRVMATCAVLGQAVGTAVSIALELGCMPGSVPVQRLQQTLLRDDCYIPFVQRQVSPLTMRARINAEVVRNGRERGEENCWIGKAGDSLVYTLEEPAHISGIRLVFDSDLNRDYKNMPCNYPLKQTKYRLPETLIRDFDLILDETQVLEFRNNRQRFVWIPADETVRCVRLVPKATHGCDTYRVFGFELEE